MADKDQHIATLTRQIELLQVPKGAVSEAQEQQLQTIQAEVKAQETAIQHQEARIETLKQRMHRPTPSLDPKAIKREVRDAVGDKVWYYLQTQSQKDLYAAYKHMALAAVDGTDQQTADYSEAGLRLGDVVEREVVQPCLTDLHAFLQSQGQTTLANLPLGKARRYTLAMAVPLWTDAWTTIRPAALKTAQPPSDQQLYVAAQPGHALSAGDRALLAAFLAQWEHPMSAWFQAHGEAAATYLDQISQLHQFAAQATNPLYLWAFEHMRELVIGDAQTPGLLPSIYA